MPKQFIDLTVILTDQVASEPPGLEPEITYLDHAAVAAEFGKMFGVPDGASDPRLRNRRLVDLLGGHKVGGHFGELSSVWREATWSSQTGTSRFVLHWSRIRPA